jgi:hypothetical protein
MRATPFHQLHGATRSQPFRFSGSAVVREQIDGGSVGGVEAVGGGVDRAERQRLLCPQPLPLRVERRGVRRRLALAAVELRAAAAPQPGSERSGGESGRSSAGRSSGRSSGDDAAGHGRREGGTFVG